MKELSPAEYRTILAILAHPRSTERDRIRQARLPSSTFNVARRRVFGEGWLSDVMIPNPGAYGYHSVEVLLARPTVSDRDGLLRTCANDPECVVLWAGIHAVFGVFFRRARRPSPTDGTAQPVASDAFRVVATQETGTVPAYFDYSGLWARFGAQPRPPGYPAGLRLDSNGADVRGLPEIGSGWPSGHPPDPASGSWTSVARLPRALRRALDRGLVQNRTVLNPRAIPALQGRRIGEVIAIRGHLRPGATALGMLNSLTADCHVYPFLVAHGEGKLIVAGMGQLSSAESGRVPVAAARRSVSSVVEQFVDRADVLIEPAESITEVVHHRYPPLEPSNGTGQPNP